MTYIIEYGTGDYLGEDIELTPHDTFDRDYFCTFNCYSSHIENNLELITSTIHNTGPKAVGKNGNPIAPYNYISAGEYPCAESEADGPIYCAYCESLMKEEAENEA
jgi:hypothetical protein